MNLVIIFATPRCMASGVDTEMCRKLLKATFGDLKARKTVAQVRVQVEGFWCSASSCHRTCASAMKKAVEGLFV